jgi:hypothetical protein
VSGCAMAMPGGHTDSQLDIDGLEAYLNALAVQ